MTTLCKGSCVDVHCGRKRLRRHAKFHQPCRTDPMCSAACQTRRSAHALTPSWRCVRVAYAARRSVWLSRIGDGVCAPYRARRAALLRMRVVRDALANCIANRRSAKHDSQSNERPKLQRVYAFSDGSNRITLQRSGTLGCWLDMVDAAGCDGAVAAEDLPKAAAHHQQRPSQSSVTPASESLTDAVKNSKSRFGGSAVIIERKWWLAYSALKLLTSAQA